PRAIWPSFASSQLFFSPWPLSSANREARITSHLRWGLITPSIRGMSEEPVEKTSRKGRKGRKEFLFQKSTEGRICPSADLRVPGGLCVRPIRVFQQAANADASRRFSLSAVAQPAGTFHCPTATRAAASNPASH